MFCPRCGNQPAADRPRFCPSCGFRLDAVIDLLTRDGSPMIPQFIPQIKEPSPRRRGIQRGAKITFTGLAMFLPILAFAIGVADHPGPLVLPATIILAGVLWMLYSWLFGDEHSPPRPVQVVNPPIMQPPYLPPQSVPVHRPSLERPQGQSVIEHTTRSLEKQ